MKANADAHDIAIGVIGLGHVGLPTALGLADLGWRVVGVDNDAAKARLIASGEPPFYEPGLGKLLRKRLDSGDFSVESDAASAVRQSNIIIVCVGTPQREDGSADLSYIEIAGKTIAANLNGYKLVVEKSTTPVRTAERLRDSIRRYSAASGNGAAPDFDVAVNPEFLREGAALHDFFNPDRVVIGAARPRAAKLLSRVYAPLFQRAGKPAADFTLITDINTAEIIKHASNAFLATKVSFMNMVADLCEATDADITHVARGLGLDHRIAPHFLQAGIGFGGYCLPKDIKAFERVADEHGVDFGLLKEVGRVNDGRVDRFIDTLSRALWVVKGKTIAVWGLSFKPLTDDVRDSPSIGVVERLLRDGARLRLHDPQAMSEFAKRFPSDPPALEYADSPEAAAHGADAALLLTEWDDYLRMDMKAVRGAMSMPLIFDGRNLLDPEALRAIGFEYYGIGRP